MVTGGGYIERLFNSIFNQRYRKLQLIFVNDGSTDDTELEVLSYRKKFEQIFGNDSFIYLFQENQGVGFATNNGIKYIKGDYFVIFDCDDFFEPDYFEEMISYFQQNPNKKLVTNDVNLIENDNFTGIAKGNTGSDLFLRYMLYKFKYTTYIKFMFETKAFDSVVVNRDIYASKFGQNAQFVLPMLYRYEAGYIEKPLYNVVIHSDSHSRTAKNIDDFMAMSAGYEDIYINTIKRMNIPEEKEYLIMIRENYYHTRFKNAFWVYRFDYVKENYKKLKKLKKLTADERKMYSRRFCLIEYWSQKQVWKFIKKIKHMFIK